MSTQIFVNLPVESLPRAVAFFTALGFSFNPQFTDDNATCMIVADNIFVMLLTRSYFAGFTPKPVSDAHASTEVLICLSRENREAIESMVATAVAAGGRAPRPAKDHGFMYQHAFEDPDGHLWELVHMSGMPA
jgi:predicted lactoylglutathione lyase